MSRARLLLALVVLVGALAGARMLGLFPSGVGAQLNAPTDAWADVAPLPQVRKRAVAAAYPPTGKIYLFGGRFGVDGEDLQRPTIFEYTPGDPGAWEQKAAQLPYSTHDPGRVVANNMVAATLTGTDGVAIYIIGGNDRQSTPSGATLSYNPISDTITTLDADPWPATPSRVPGGYAILDNKLYLFGGFNAYTGAVYAETWCFDPRAAAGSRWTLLKTANLTQARAYIAGATLDGAIYAVGGDTYSAPNLVPVTTVERLTLGAGPPAWAPVASLPTPRGDMGAWAFPTGSSSSLAGRILTAGGVWFTPDAQGYQYIAAQDIWVPFANLIHATRNYGAAQLDTDLYVIGGYDFSSTLPDSGNAVQRYRTSTGATPTPVPSATVTSTAPPRSPTSTPPPSSPTPMRTTTPAPCVITFSDVPATDYFYSGVRYLVCHNAVSGYDDNTYRPYVDVTRGQLIKILVLAFGVSGWTPSTPTFADVPPAHPFYPYIEAAAHAGIVSGYTETDGSFTFRPYNNMTRGQATKALANAAGWPLLNPPTATFVDVSAANPFYRYVETAVARGAISGYTCATGTCREFRGNASIRRGQTAKIVFNALGSPR